MTHYTNAVENRIDTTVHSYAAMALSGEMSETEARWAILAALTEIDVPEYVATRVPDLDRQTREDLRDSLAILIETKALQTEPGGLDLRMVRETSACGWARNLANIAVRSYLRNIRAARKRAVAVDPTATPLADAYNTSAHNAAATNAFHLRPADTRNAQDEIADLGAETLLEEFTDASAGMRKARRLHVSARTLRKQYDVPECIRPDDLVEREWVRAELTANPDLARLGAAALYACIEDMETLSQRGIDDRILALWDDYTSTQLLHLIEKPAAVAHTIALAAVSGYAKPSRDTVEEAIRLCVLATGNDTDKTTHREFRPKAKALINAWVASECEAVSEFNTKSTLTPEQEMERLTSALSWPELAQWATTLPGAPLGRHISDVAGWIRTAINTFGDMVTTSATAAVTQNA